MCLPMSRTLRFLSLAVILLRVQSLAQDLAITHAGVFDGHSAVLQRDMTILIQGERIVRVEASKSLKVPGGYKVLDLTGRYVIPGLWDMHVHLAGLSADPKWSADVLLPRLVE